MGSQLFCTLGHLDLGVVTLGLSVELEGGSQVLYPEVLSRVGVTFEAVRSKSEGGHIVTKYGVCFLRFDVCCVL